MAQDAPNRWLHLRSQAPFSGEDFERFVACCEIWRQFVTATIARREHIPDLAGHELDYVFHEPELTDPHTATLPLGGAWTTGSRAFFEDARFRILWQLFPVTFLLQAEEGLTEDFGAGEITSWRPCLRPLPHTSG